MARESSNMVDTIYVFGAGASYGSLPVINEFETAIDILKTVDVTFEKFISSTFDNDILKTIKQFKSPDNFAKWLYLSERDKEKSYQGIKDLYSKLIFSFTKNLQLIIDSIESETSKNQNMLSEVEELKREELNNLNAKFRNYFRLKNNFIEIDILIENEKSSYYIDSRYLLFLLSTLKSSKKENHLEYLTNTFHFYNWNYDRSLELAFASIQGSSKIRTSGYPELVEHLNGYVPIFNNSETKINFFWEDQKKLDLIPQAKNCVFIGYSFPDYNYDLDSKLLASLLKHSTTIFIQDIQASKIKKKIIARKEVKSFFNKIRPGKFEGYTKQMIDQQIIEIEDVDSFIIPNSLD